MTHDRADQHPYGYRMRDETTALGTEFATWVRDARLAAGLTQEQVLTQAAIMVEHNGGPELSKSTLNRWEGGKTTTVRAENLRLFCTIVGADVREALIALGYIAREELGLPPAPAIREPVLADAAKILASEDIAPAAKDSLRKLISQAVGFTYDTLGLRRPPKPDNAARTSGRPVKRS